MIHIQKIGNNRDFYLWKIPQYADLFNQTLILLISMFHIPVLGRGKTDRSIPQNNFKVKNPLEFQLSVTFPEDAFNICCHLVAKQDLVPDWGCLEFDSMERKYKGQSVPLFHIFGKISRLGEFYWTVWSTLKYKWWPLNTIWTGFCTAAARSIKSEKRKHMVLTFLSVHTHLSHKWRYSNWFSENFFLLLFS